MKITTRLFYLLSLPLYLVPSLATPTFSVAAAADEQFKLFSHWKKSCCLWFCLVELEIRSLAALLQQLSRLDLQGSVRETLRVLSQPSAFGISD